MRVREHPFAPGSLELLVGEVPQSQINPNDPTHLAYEYVRRIGHAIDLTWPGGEALHALHLGGGGMTLPRYVTATHVHSRQTVIEANASVARIVQERMPLRPAEAASIDLVIGDAFTETLRLSREGSEPFDLVVVDVYDGTDVPPYVTNGDIFPVLASLTVDDGIVAVNIIDEPGLPAVRRQWRALTAVFPGVIVLGPTTMFTVTGSGNAVIVASMDRPGLDGRVAALRSLGPHPATALDTAEGARLLG